MKQRERSEVGVGISLQSTHTHVGALFQKVSKWSRDQKSRQSNRNTANE